jgi:hypothetical protein
MWPGSFVLPGHMSIGAGRVAGRPPLNLRPGGGARTFAGRRGAATSRRAPTVRRPEAGVEPATCGITASRRGPLWTAGGSGRRGSVAARGRLSGPLLDRVELRAHRFEGPADPAVVRTTPAGRGGGVGMSNTTESGAVCAGSGSSQPPGPGPWRASLDGAGRGSRSPWWCRVGGAGPVRPGAWRALCRSVAVPPADHARSTSVTNRQVTAVSTVSGTHTQVGFSRAICSTRARIGSVMGGRPDRRCG